MSRQESPFQIDDADRYAIWQMLVVRDTEAFCAPNWEQVAGDFDEKRFLGIQGAEAPALWEAKFPTLSHNRDAWLEQARHYVALHLEGESVLQFLRRATRLDRIDIQSNAALAHKVFDGRAVTTSGEKIELKWQAVYLLRKEDGRWKIAGFVGYLPYERSRIHRPPSQQHRTAGPYSPVLRISSGPLVAISGQGPIDAEGRILGSNFEEQARLPLENCRR